MDRFARAITPAMWLYIVQVSSKFVPGFRGHWGYKFGHSDCFRYLAFTTACATVGLQAVIFAVKVLHSRLMLLKQKKKLAL